MGKKENRRLKEDDGLAEMEQDFPDSAERERELKLREDLCKAVLRIHQRGRLEARKEALAAVKRKKSGKTKSIKPMPEPIYDREYEGETDDELTLAGKCLVYIGSAHKDKYDEAVVYITDCAPDSVKGIIINKLMFATAAIECQEKNGREETEDGEPAARSVYEDLYSGGPVNPAHGFVLFPSDEIFCSDPTARVQGEIAISNSFGVLQDILDGIGPEKKIIAMGHCVWKRGELEWEIFNNEWLIVPGNSELIFDTSFEERWEKAKQASGLNLGGFIPRIGLA